MEAMRNVLLAVGCAVLTVAMVAPASAALITGIQYSYDANGGTCGGGEAAYIGTYTTTAASSGTLKDGYITLQADVNANAAFTVPAYTIGLGPAGTPAIYGTYYGPIVDFKLNGSYNLSSMLIGYTQKLAYGVGAPSSVSISVNGGSVLGTYTGFDNSIEYYPNGDARTYSIDLTSLNLTGVQTVRLVFPSAKEWTALNEIQFDGVVPEPAAVALLAAGLLACGWRKRK